MGSAFTLDDTVSLTRTTKFQQQNHYTTSDLVVTSATQRYHPSCAKAWVSYNTVTTTSIYSSYNITSLTDNGQGNTTLNFTNTFSATTSYVACGSGNYTTLSAGYKTFIPYSAGPATTSIRVGTSNGAGINLDMNYENVVIYGIEA